MVQENIYSSWTAINQPLAEGIGQGGEDVQISGCKLCNQRAKEKEWLDKEESGSELSTWVSSSPSSILNF